jgi:hypothetical protein
MALFLILTRLNEIHAQYQTQIHDVVSLQLREAAKEDLLKQPPGDYYYLYLPEQKQNNENKNFFSVLSFVLASTSTQQILDYCTPQKINNSLFRINLEGLKWSPTAFQKILKNYPYDPNRQNPLYIRADWLISQLTDTTASNAYYLLLYNKLPSQLDRDSILSQWGVVRNSSLAFGLIENDSGVALSKTRILQNFPILRGYAWGTLDAISADPFVDAVPPFTNYKHEAEEWIIGAPKFVLQTNPPLSGTLQYYFLATSTGNIINAADPSLVEDKSRFKNNPQIRTPGSCIQCHSQGLNFPTTNALQQLIKSGADIYADKETQTTLELFHLLPAKESIEESNKKFQKIQHYLTKMTPPEFLEAFRSVINNYEKPLTLEEAGKDVNYGRFNLALGNTSTTAFKLDARLVGLAHNIPISRRNWEKQFYNAVNAVNIYNSQKEL